MVLIVCLKARLITHQLMISPVFRKADHLTFDLTTTYACGFIGLWIQHHQIRYVKWRSYFVDSTRIILGRFNVLLYQIYIIHNSAVLLRKHA